MTTSCRIIFKSDQLFVAVFFFFKHCWEEKGKWMYSSRTWNACTGHAGRASRKEHVGCANLVKSATVCKAFWNCGFFPCVLVVVDVIRLISEESVFLKTNWTWFFIVCFNPFQKKVNLQRANGECTPRQFSGWMEGKMKREWRCFISVIWHFPAKVSVLLCQCICVLCHVELKSKQT